MHVFDREGRRKSSGPALFARVHLRVRQQVFPSYSARPAMLPGKVSLVLEPFPDRQTERSRSSAV